MYAYAVPSHAMKSNIRVNRPRHLYQTGASNENRDEENLSPRKRTDQLTSLSNPGTSNTIMDASSRLVDCNNHGSVSVSNGNIAKSADIAAKLMEVAEKTERCWDCDLQSLLDDYQTTRSNDVNFPEAGMVISSAAQIYGRKVDYVNDIVVHMVDDQKAREKKTLEENKSKAGEQGEPSNKTPSRRRTGRFNPQSLSDCFGDIEFSCSENKLLKLESLVKPVPIIVVDSRTKLQQMQELCMELRTNPSRQRRQEILNRLRDDASIAPIMSSNGSARKNQIADLESGEAIGTRYDYQIHLNYIDGRTGSLRAEHDLKCLFQLCDVIDFLDEQHEIERARCHRLGMPAPSDRLWQAERWIKLYMPPEYLNDRYRIKVHDTTDFDNAVIQARVTNYNSDPILSLMDHALRAEQIAAETAVRNDTTVDAFHTLDDSGIANSTTIVDENHELSLNGVLSSTRTNESALEQSTVANSTGTSAIVLSQSSEQDTPQESSTEAVEDSLLKQSSTEKSLTAVSRLSVDEGIGVDCEALTPQTTLVNLIEENIIKPRMVMFTPGMVFPRAPDILRPGKLVQNILGIPEELVFKNGPFTLTMEYRKLKNEFVKRHEKERENELSYVKLHSLKPTADSMLRPSTPDEEEDFLGFDEETDQTPVKASSPRKTKSSTPSSESSPIKQRRPSTPSEPNFEGFDEEEILATRRNVAEVLKRLPENPKSPCSPSKRTNGSLPGTPTRTLSCDSGISDTVDRTGRQQCVRPIANSLLNSIEENAANSDCDFVPNEGDRQDNSLSHQAPSQHHTDACNARIEEKMNEAKERFDKVSQWHRNLKPILMESEKRTHFDIHAYGTEIIDTFDPTVPLGGESITLERVLQNKAPNSTARFFLSVLMLANTNNIEINNRNQDPHRLSTTSEIELRLLSRKRHHKELEALPANDSGTATEINLTKRQNRKRKHLQQQHEEQSEQQHGEGTARADPSSRVGALEGMEGCDDGASFFDNVQEVYAKLNSERSQHKRIAFRRGMRNCAYGLIDEGSKAKEGGEPSTVAQPGKEAPSGQTGDKPSPRTVQRNGICPSPIMMDSGEDLLSVDLLTNQAILVSAGHKAANSVMDAKSVFSLAESGYESMLSIADDV